MAADTGVNDLLDLDAAAAAARLSALPDEDIARYLRTMGPGRAVAILERFDAQRRARITAA